jgi:diaminopimelate epimerase
MGPFLLLQSIISTRNPPISQKHKEVVSAMQFTKMNGAGNDFIILNNLTEHLPVSSLPELARVLCRRRLSIGADGLMVVEASTQGGNFRMLFYNADGSEGEMCGNGARCICRYGYEHGLAGEEQRVETPSGIVTGRRIDRRHYRVRLTDPTVVELDHPLEAGGVTYPCAYIELGTPGLPHAVIPMENLAERSMDDLRPLAAALRRHPSFPKGANVNFYDLTAPDRLQELTFERGVEDFTYACGTGTGSVVLALTLRGIVSGQDVRVTMPGGELRITVEREGEAVRNLYLTGPTNVVCEGRVTDEELGTKG